MRKCNDVYIILLTSNEKILGTTKYELSLCHECYSLHVDVEDGICNICGE